MLLREGDAINSFLHQWSDKISLTACAVAILDLAESASRGQML
jgi:hypothetical protein